MKYVDTVIVTKLIVLDVAPEGFDVAVHVFKPTHTQLMNNTFSLHNLYIFLYMIYTFFIHYLYIVYTRINPFCFKFIHV